MITTTAGADPTEGQVRDRLRNVIDPEVGIGIVDLGLIYDVAIDDQTISITMTMTTPACPLGSYLQQSAEYALADLAGQRLIEIDLVVDPPWDPEMITQEGRAQLGWSG